MQAGVQFRDIYAFVEENNFTFVGGLCDTPFLLSEKLTALCPQGVTLE